VNALAHSHFRPRAVAIPRKFTREDLAAYLDHMSGEELMLLGWQGPLSIETAERKRQAIAELKNKELNPRGFKWKVQSAPH